MKQLLEAGVHFGHQTRKWNPKMGKYIFMARNDIHIINLEDTAVLVDRAYAFVKQQAEEGKIILFVGTKKQAQQAIADEAKRCGMYYINSRWLGGTLTNFKTIRSSIDRLNNINRMEKIGEFNILPKKEVIKLKAERDKLEKNLGGIKDMPRIPDVLFIVDPKKEHIAVSEAKSLGLPIVALVDTNCNPDPIDYIIPGNDDAIRAVSLIAGAIANAVIEAKEGKTPVTEEEAKEGAEKPTAETMDIVKETEETEKTEKAEKAEKAEKVEKTEKVEKAEKTEIEEK